MKNDDNMMVVTGIAAYGSDMGTAMIRAIDMISVAIQKARNNGMIRDCMSIYYHTCILTVVRMAVQMIIRVDENSSID